MSTPKRNLKLVKSDAVPKAMLADLARSGLTAEDAEQMHLRYHSEAQTSDIVAGITGFKGAWVASYFIPYMKLNGAPVAPMFGRYKLLGVLKLKGDKKPRKYLQPADTAPQIYLPNLCDWAKIAKDPSIDIYIGEREKKAYAGCKAGYAAIGLGGVFSFLTDGTPIEDFGLINWVHRRVYIVFDSDSATNPNVQLATQKLRDVLVAAKALPYQIDLPPTRGKGWDDQLLKRNGKELFAKLPRRPLLVPDGETAAALLQRAIPPIRWAVPLFIPAGLTLLVGAPKIGKSWLALELCMAVTAGRPPFGLRGDPTKAGEVLYLALEDPAIRLQNRLRKLMEDAAWGGAAQLHLHRDWPRDSAGGLVALERWLEMHLQCRLVIVDTLARFRTAPTRQGHLYFEDQEALIPLKRLADERNVAILAVTHLRKAADDDPLNMITGSVGVPAAVDTILVLHRARNTEEATLLITSRDYEEQEYAMGLKGGRWTWLGLASARATTREQRALQEAMKLLKAPGTPTEIAALAGRKREATQNMLIRMANEGSVIWHEGGKYSLPPEAAKGEEK